MIWRTAAFTTLESAVNQCLRLDPTSRERLARLTGKVIAIEVRGLNISIYLVPGLESMQVLAGIDGSADTTLRATPLTLLRMGLSSGRQEGLFSGDVEIEGDMETGQCLKEIIDTMEIDWEEQLSRITGDMIARKAGNTARSLKDWALQSVDTLGQDIGEYLREESRMLAGCGDVEAFMTGVDRVRGDVDRLEQRILRLQRRLEGEAESGQELSPGAGS